MKTIRLGRAFPPERFPRRPNSRRPSAAANSAKERPPTLCRTLTVTEDLSAAAPGAVGADGLYSYDSSKDGALNGGTLNGIQNQNGSDASFNSSTTGTTAADLGDENYDPADPVEDWLATEGSSVRSLLTQWGDKAGWRVVWNTDREYILEAGAMFRGRFMDVASALIRSFARAQPSPWGTFYKGNRVLLVTTQEDENAD